MNVLGQNSKYDAKNHEKQGFVVKKEEDEVTFDFKHAWTYVVHGSSLYMKIHIHGHICTTNDEEMFKFMFIKPPLYIASIQAKDRVTEIELKTDGDFSILFSSFVSLGMLTILVFFNLTSFRTFCESSFSKDEDGILINYGKYVYVKLNSILILCLKYTCAYL